MPWGERPATWADVERVCGFLNEAGAKYVLHGGFPLSLWLGETDYTGDIDLAIPKTLPAYEVMRHALARLGQQKILRYEVLDLIDKNSIRLIDDVVIDIVPYVSAIHYDDLEKINVVRRPANITIPMVTGDCLVRIKEFAARRSVPAHRAKHKADLDSLMEVGYGGNYEQRVIPLDVPLIPYSRPGPDTFDMDDAGWLS